MLQAARAYLTDLLWLMPSASASMLKGVAWVGLIALVA
jgi:hypothetical protein